jgi:hemerythrin-like domain-containing protein
VIAVAREMCLAHNAMIRNLNAIYLQCEQVTELKDRADFIIFCQAAIEVIHTHHQMEETNFFPQVAEYTGEKNIMEVNIEQHRAFDAGLQIFEDHIYKLTPERYDGVELKKLLDGFANVLVVHLSDEIQTLLALQKYGGEKLGVVFENFNKKVMASVKDKVCSSLSPCSNTGLGQYRLTVNCSIVCFHALLVASTGHSRAERMPTFLPFHSLYPT